MMTEEKSWIDTVLEYLGLTENNGYIDKGSYIQGIPPCHEGADNPNGFSLLFEGPGGPVWKCWTHLCHEKYGCGIAGLIMAIKKVDKEEAHRILKSEFIGTKKEQIKKEFIEIDYLNKHMNQEIAAPFELKPADEYLKERKIDPEVARYYCIGIGVRKGIMKDRLVIPIRNVKGNIVGYSGRDPKFQKGNKGNKWAHSKGFSAGINLFNIDRVKKRGLFTVVIVEGILDVLRLEMAGINNAVCVFGNSLTRGQINILSQLRIKEVTLAFDNDEAGIIGMKKAINKLKKQGIPTFIMKTNGEKDWAEMALSDIRNSYNNREVV